MSLCHHSGRLHRWRCTAFALLLLSSSVLQHVGTSSSLDLDRVHRTRSTKSWVSLSFLLFSLLETISLLLFASFLQNYLPCLLKLVFSLLLVASVFSFRFLPSNVPLLNQYLTAGCDVNATSDFFSQIDGDYLDGATALIIAATDHCNDAVTLLLQNGANVLLTNRNGESAIHRACWSGTEAILDQLIEFGALLDEPNFNGLTPSREKSLVWCSDGCSTRWSWENCGVFFEWKSQRKQTRVIDVSLVNSSYEGNTAAHFAASQNRSNILRLLMDHNCSLSLVNHDNHTPIDYCTESRITCFLLTGWVFSLVGYCRGKVPSLGKPVTPYTCLVPFQLPPALLPLFMIGLNVMRHVAYGIGVYPVFPFCMLQVGLILMWQTVLWAACSSETSVRMRRTAS